MPKVLSSIVYAVRKLLGVSPKSEYQRSDPLEALKVSVDGKVIYQSRMLQAGGSGWSNVSAACRDAAAQRAKQNKPFKIDPALEAISKGYDEPLKDVFANVEPLKRVELPADAASWKDYPLRDPRKQKHYDSVDDMLRQLLDGPWKWHVHPGHGSTDIKNYVSYKTDTGREVAFRLYGRSLFDQRVFLEIEIGAKETPEFEASFECAGKEFGSAAPEIKTAGPEALLDLCNVVIAGKLDRFNHESSKHQAIHKEAS